MLLGMSGFKGRLILQVQSFKRPGARQHQHINPLGSGLFEDAGAGVHCGAGGEHVVNQHDVAIPDQIFPARCEHEGSGNIGPALLFAQPHLGAGGAMTLEREDINGNGGEAGHFERQQGRLVEAPVPQPCAGQGDGKQKIGISEKIPAGQHHPASEQGEALAAIAIFEPVNERLHHIAKQRHRAGAITDRGM